MKSSDGSEHLLLNQAAQTLGVICSMLKNSRGKFVVAFAWLCFGRLGTLGVMLLVSTHRTFYFALQPWGIWGSINGEGHEVFSQS